MPKPTRYDSIIVEIFKRHYKKGKKEFSFDRSELEKVAKVLKVELPKNLGDLLYSYRFRKDLPKEISDTATMGNTWTIELAGQASYKFRLSKVSRVVPRSDLIQIKIPDSTPEIIGKYALSDEQALLAKVRYNRLIDIFLGITTYSLQNHLRTTVSGMGQIEIDEIYVGVNRNGVQFIVPVQAKGGKDQIGTVQTKQDIACCKEKFPELTCRPIAAQFLANDLIAMFELASVGDEIKVTEEKHYKLLPADQISKEDLKGYVKIDK
jgi:hypothetical protein